MTKTELKKINSAMFSYLTRYMYTKTDFNHAFLKLAKELGVLEQLIKDFILSLSNEDKKQLREVLIIDMIAWKKLDEFLYYRCLGFIGGLID